MSEKQDNAATGTPPVEKNENAGVQTETVAEGAPQTANAAAAQQENLQKPADGSNEAPAAQDADKTVSAPKEASAPEDSAVAAAGSEATATGSQDEAAATVDFADDENGEADAAAESVADAGLCGKLFTFFSKIAPLFLLVAIAAMVWPDYWHSAQALYCPAEKGTIASFLNSMSQHSWFAPAALENSLWSKPIWPVFIWYMAGLAAIPHLGSSDLLLPVAGSLSAFLAVLAVWTLCLCARFGRGAAFAASLVLLCCPLFAPLPNFIGPTTLGISLMLFSLACFARGWRVTNAWFSLPLGFALAVLAGMCSGLLYFIIPLAASLCYIIWRGSFRRAQALDALAGFIIMLVIAGVWICLVTLHGNNDNYLPTLLSGEFKFATLQASSWKPIMWASLGCLPWLLMIFAVSWLRVIKTIPAACRDSRHENGSAIIWTGLVLTCALSLFSTQIYPAIIAIVCLFAPLMGRAFMRLTQMGNRFFFLLVSICVFLAGLALLCASFSFSQHWLWALTGCTPKPEICSMFLAAPAIWVLGLICILGAVILALLCVRSYRDGGGLLFCTILTLILCQPTLLMLVPELGANQASGLVTYSAIKKTVAPAPVMEIKAVPTKPEAAPDAVAKPAPVEESQPAVNQEAKPENETVKPEESAARQQPQVTASEPADAAAKIEPEQAQAPAAEQAPAQAPEPVTEQPQAKPEVPVVNQQAEEAAAQAAPAPAAPATAEQQAGKQVESADSAPQAENTAPEVKK